MKKDVSLKIELLEGVEVTLKGGNVTVKNKDKELHKRFNLGKLTLRQENNSIFIEAKKGTKREQKLAGTVQGIIGNMVKGVTEGFTYKLQVAGSHFPMRVEVDSANKIITVTNFLGERVPRKAKIVDGVEVKMQGDTITVTSIDKQAAGQTAGNLEASTKVRGKDRRIFQDGIYLVEKPRK